MQPRWVGQLSHTYLGTSPFAVVHRLGFSYDSHEFVDTVVSYAFHDGRFKLVVPTLGVHVRVEKPVTVEHLQPVPSCPLFDSGYMLDT